MSEYRIIHSYDKIHDLHFYDPQKHKSFLGLFHYWSSLNDMMKPIRTISKCYMYIYRDKHSLDKGFVIEYQGDGSDVDIDHGVAKKLDDKNK